MAPGPEAARGRVSQSVQQSKTRRRRHATHKVLRPTSGQTGSCRDETRRVPSTQSPCLPCLAVGAHWERGGTRQDCTSTPRKSRGNAPSQERNKCSPESPPFPHTSVSVCRAMCPCCGCTCAETAVAHSQPCSGWVSCQWPGPHCAPGDDTGPAVCVAAEAAAEAEAGSHLGSSSSRLPGAEHATPAQVRCHPGRDGGWMGGISDGALRWRVVNGEW